MTTEDVQGQLGRSAAVERELREQLAAAKAEVAEARFRPMGDNHHNAAQCPYCGDPLRAATASAEKAERERDEARFNYEHECEIYDAACVELTAATARIAELEGALRDLAAAIGRCGCDNDEHAHYCHEARERIFSLAALAPNAPPKVDWQGLAIELAQRVRCLEPNEIGRSCAEQDPDGEVPHCAVCRILQAASAPAQRTPAPEGTNG